MKDILTDISGQILGGIIFWILVGVIIYYIFNYESAEKKEIKNKIKKDEDDKKIKEQNEIENKKKAVVLQENIRKTEITSYLLFKRKVDNLDDTEIIAFMNQNIKDYNNWIKLEEEIIKEKSVYCFETSKYKIYSDYHSTSDTLCRYLKNKETGVILKKWYYSYD